MSIFSSRWNHSVNGLIKGIDHTKQEVYISFQISRRVFLDLSASTIRSKKVSFPLNPSMQKVLWGRVHGDEAKTTRIFLKHMY